MFNIKTFSAESIKLIYAIIPVLISVLLILNAFGNNGGLPKYFFLKSQIFLTEQKLKILDKDIFITRNRVNLIKGPEIDKDLLEELAYQYLGYTYKDNLFMPFR